MSIVMRDLFYKPPNASDWILKGINLNIGEGEFVLVAGPSGSGKTMLLHVISGISRDLIGGYQRGIIEIKPETKDKLGKGAKIKIGFMPQSFENQLLSFDVKDELLISAINSGKEEYLKRFNDIVKDLNLEGLLDRYVFNLSYGELQRVALGTILLFDYDILLLDEPLAQLDRWATRGLLKILRSLKKEGKTIIVAEHRINKLTDIADRIVLLQDGRKIIEGSYSDIRPLAEKLGLRTGRMEISANPISLSSNEDYIIKVENLSFSWSHDRIILDNVNFDIPYHNIRLIYGPNGSGKTTFSQILAGYIKGYKGQITRNGKVVFIPQNPDKFLMYDSVFQEVFYPLVNGGIEPKYAEKEALNLLSHFRLADKTDLDPFSLSKGEKYRLAVASAIASGANLIILDEPTFGQDYKGLVEIIKLLNSYIESGDKSALLFTCDYDFFLAFKGEKYIIEGGMVREFY